MVGANVEIDFPKMRGERGERERKHTRANEQMSRTPLPKPLDSIYMGGGDGCLHFIILVG
jgi:hypothetical protein